MEEEEDGSNGDIKGDEHRRKDKDEMTERSRKTEGNLRAGMKEEIKTERKDKAKRKQ